MNDVLNQTLTADLCDMATHGNVTGIARRRQLARKIERNRMFLLLQVARKHVPPLSGERRIFANPWS